MRHAYLVIAHGNWEQLCLLLKQLDDKNNDIYLHVDKKAQKVPFEKIRQAVIYSKINIFQEYKVYWGSYEMVLVELLLLEEATKCNYDYYHLMSGTDLMIKPLSEVNRFFEENNGYEFIHFDNEQRLIEDKEIKRRTKLYHFFNNYRKRFKLKLLNSFFTFLARSILMLQIILGIDRTKKYKNIKIMYGSQWFSITNSCAQYVLSQKYIINRVFHRTKCSDELFLQTIVYNSDFEKKLYDRMYDNSIEANMRLIDINVRGKNGSPYVWKTSDLKEIKLSKCLFARKFDVDIDKNVINQVLNMTNGEKKDGED